VNRELSRDLAEWRAKTMDIYLYFF
jgi:hypothetical protein